MQVKQLISFITAARTKNMAQTALALNYSHSTIYGHIEALEREFHTKLYLRTPGAQMGRYLRFFTAANAAGLLLLGVFAALMAHFGLF